MRSDDLATALPSRTEHLSQASCLAMENLTLAGRGLYQVIDNLLPEGAPKRKSLALLEDCILRTYESLRLRDAALRTSVQSGPDTQPNQS